MQKELEKLGYMHCDKRLSVGNIDFYLATQESNQKKVIIKVLNALYSSDNDIINMKREYEILQKLHKSKYVPNIVEFIDKEDITAIVRDSVSYKNLTMYLDDEKHLSLDQTLSMAISCAEFLEEIHQLDIIHKNFNINNMFYEIKSNKLMVIDFSLATDASLPIEATSGETQFIEGNLAYISPEQTARMSSLVDYRSDYYSLGATLYQLLTNQLPFKGNDANELVYAHLATTPKAINQVNPNIPDYISNIIMKLIAKEPKFRYQSSQGLIYDLRKAKKMLQDDFKGGFEIGSKDIALHLNISKDFIIDREEEISTITNNYQKVLGGGSHLIMITGAAGIGKTSLIRYAKRELDIKDGWFVLGQIEYSDKSNPYYALSQALDAMIKSILILPIDKVETLRSKLINQLGNDLKILLDFIPSLKHLCKINSEEDKNKDKKIASNPVYVQLIVKFIKLLSNQSSPLVIGLDNLQWASDDFLKLLKTLCFSKIPYLYMILACRSDSKEGDNIGIADAFKSLEGDVSELNLQPFTKVDIVSYLSEVLHSDNELLKELAEVVLAKTLGNPLFLKKLIIQLDNEQIIYFDNNLGKWQWDIDLIKQQQDCENVIDVLVENISEVDKNLKHILSIAACFGYTFSISLMAEITKTDQAELFNDLRMLINKGYLVRSETNDNKSDKLSFVHDKIYQAASKMVSSDLYLQTHLDIAKNLYNQAESRGDLTSRIFEIVDHFNHLLDVSEELSLPKEELERIIKCDILAGNNSKQAKAFEVALKFYEKALKWCQIIGMTWDENYVKLMDLHINCMKCAFVVKDIEKVLYYKEEIEKKLQNLEDESRMLRVYLDYLASEDRHDDVIDLTLVLYNKVGVKIAKKTTFMTTLFSYVKTKIMLHHKSIKDINNLHTLSNKSIKIVFDHMDRLVMCSVLSGKITLTAKLASICPRLLFKYGQYNKSTLVSYYGVLEKFFNRIPSALKWADMAISLADKINIKIDKLRLMFQLDYLVLYHRTPIHQQIKNYYHYYEDGIYLGNSPVAHGAIWAYCQLKYLAGYPLSKFSQEVTAIHQKLLLNMLEDPSSVKGVATILQGCINLTNKSKPSGNYSDLSGEIFDETKRKESLNRHNFTLMIITKLQISYILDDSSITLDLVKQVTGKHLLTIKNTYFESIFYFYKSLIYLDSIKSVSYKKRAKMLKQVKRSIKNFKYYAKYAPANFAAKSLLLQAKYYDYKNKDAQVQKCYEEAFQFAKKYECLHDQAISYEFAFKFYKRQKRLQIASYYLFQAIQSYNKWEAFTKVDQLQEQYRDILNLVDISTTKELSLPFGVKSVSDTELDINSLQKSINAISSTVIIDKLLEKLIHLIIENAGAQNGCVLLPKDDEYYIEAKTGKDNKIESLFKSIPINPELIAEKVLHYVIRTKESLVLDHACKNSDFKNDIYINKNKIKSIICLPLTTKGKITAVIYLENNMIPRAFTEDRIEQLKFLSGQMAMSIENAKLYSKANQLNKAYQRFVPKDFITILGKKSVTDVTLGDYIESNMSVMFLDIRNFTEMSEKMTPEETFTFINDFLAYMEPVIHKHNGFIDKYIGDAIMALFPESADDALKCSKVLLHSLEKYNIKRKNNNLSAIRIGIGINTGDLVLGTVGTAKRMDGTVLSDTVNIAARLEKLNKKYGTSLMISDVTYKKLNHDNQKALSKISQVEIRGKKDQMSAYTLKSKKSLSK